MVTLAVPDHTATVRIPAGGKYLEGDLTIPTEPRGVVLFAHGSGSSRKSPRNQTVALELANLGLATLLFDLLTESESRFRANVFDIPLLADRLVAATQWARERADLHGLRVGYFGASTGAGAALVAAARLDGEVHAVVSRGGRPDLAREDLPRVTAPTLLIVGGADEPVIGLNRMAMEHLKCECRLELVPHATHLFEEPGALERVSRLAGDWFMLHLYLEARRM